MPLSVYHANGCFKLYVSDIGILTAMIGFEAKKTIVENTIKGFAKGGIYENAIVQQLVSRGYDPCYYQKNSSVGEIDFLIENASGIVPIEVKAGRTSSESFRIHVHPWKRRQGGKEGDASALHDNVRVATVTSIRHAAMDWDSMPHILTYFTSCFAEMMYPSFVHHETLCRVPDHPY